KDMTMENKNEFVLEFAYPGLSKEDISIELFDSYIIISNEVENNFVSKSRRSFKIPNYVDVSNIEASLNNGVLKIVLPKKNRNVIEIK
ncbi:MAG: Hsp20/alpha crystallin family protein, partial [Leptonema sp. (in: bacteria)]